MSGDPAAALARLDEITRRLRVECPWDREQDERSIVPHTVEEAYELADAAAQGDDEKLTDELGDVLFQVYFLALLLEERGAGSLATVAEGMSAKLIRRHPHVFRRTWRQTREVQLRLAKCSTQLGRDQARGGGSWEGRSLRGRAREPAGASLRAQDPAPGRAGRGVASPEGLRGPRPRRALAG